MMDDRIRVSDTDRERVTARLRDHYAEGRLTREELDERVAAALNAKTVGDLKRLTTDLPQPAPVPGQEWPSQSGPTPWGGMPPMMFMRRGPRFFPLALAVLLVALLLPHGGWVFFGFFQVMLLIWLVAAIGMIFGAARFRRRLRQWPRDHRW